MNPTLTDLERLARQSGEILRLGYGHEHHVDYKNVIDLVTEVDRKSEAYLLAEIQRHFPGHQIVSEEIGLVPGRLADPVSYTHLRAHETRHDLVCRLLLEK